MKIFTTTITLLCCLVSFAKNIYVAKDGADSNSGTKASPYLSLSKAANVAVAGDIVFIREGTYEETLSPANSGTSGNPIVFQSYQNEKVVITAMKELTGWIADGDGIYKTVIDWDLGQRNFIMNGASVLDLARWPNNIDADRFTLNSLRNDGGSQDEVSANAFLTDSDIPNWDWANGGSLVFYGDRKGSGWTTWRAWIKSQSAGRINFDAIKNQSWIISAHPPGDLGDYYLEGIKEALDYDNEWFFDEDTKTVYLKLPRGAKPTDGEVKMSRRERTVNLTNRNYIHINNLAVFGGSVEIKGTGNKLYGVSSFYGSMTRGITANFNSGVNAINLSWSAVNNTVEKCEVGFGDGTGIWDSGSGTIIKNCYVHDFDFLGSYDAPIMVRGRADAKVLNNTVTRGGRDALQIISKGSEVAWNDFSQSNLIANDCALLYTVGKNRNMEIHHNWFHDAESRGDLSKAAGIYLDNDATHVNVYRNVVWNVEWTAVQMNWDVENVNIYNNTLVKAGGGAMGAWHKPGTKFTDVNVWNNIASDIVTDDPKTQEIEATFESQSDKQNNLITKIGFVNYDGNDFTLATGSAAVDMGKGILGYTDDFLGVSPDIGAYELGVPVWKPGIDWEVLLGPANRCYDLPGNICHGATTIPADTFKVLTTGVLCPGSKTGSISIESKLKLNCKADLKDASGLVVASNFVNSTDFNQLAGGNYSLCITSADLPELNQCFDLVINIPELFVFDVAVSSSAKKVNIDLSGGNLFTIQLNGETFVTDKNAIVLDLAVGENNLEIKTDKDCQGIHSQKIIIEESSFKIVENPVRNTLLMEYSTKIENVKLNIYGLLGNLIISENLKTNKNNSAVDTSGLTPGVYILKLTGKDLNETMKIVKK